MSDIKSVIAVMQEGQGDRQLRATIAVTNILPDSSANRQNAMSAGVPIVGTTPSTHTHPHPHFVHTRWHVSFLRPPTAHGDMRFTREGEGLGDRDTRRRRQCRLRSWPAALNLARMALEWA